MYINVGVNALERHRTTGVDINKHPEQIGASQYVAVFITQLYETASLQSGGLAGVGTDVDGFFPFGAAHKLKIPLNLYPNQVIADTPFITDIVAGGMCLCRLLAILHETGRFEQVVGCAFITCYAVLYVEVFHGRANSIISSYIVKLNVLLCGRYLF